MVRKSSHLNPLAKHGFHIVKIRELAAKKRRTTVRIGLDAHPQDVADVAKPIPMLTPNSCLTSACLSAYLVFYYFSCCYLSSVATMVEMYDNTCWFLICEHLCIPFYEDHFVFAFFLWFPNETC